MNLSLGTNLPWIYRTNGAPTAVARLKSLFDLDGKKVNLHEPEWRSDIVTVATVLKHYLRSLPRPLLAWDQYPAFIEAGG
jgi:hypothetical protein